jgi:hypothetical protein
MTFVELPVCSRDLLLRFYRALQFDWSVEAGELHRASVGLIVPGALKRCEFIGGISDEVFLAACRIWAFACD